MHVHARLCLKSNFKILKIKKIQFDGYSVGFAHSRWNLQIRRIVKHKPDVYFQIQRMVLKSDRFFTNQMDQFVEFELFSTSEGMC